MAEKERDGRRVQDEKRLKMRGRRRKNEEKDELTHVFHCFPFFGCSVQLRSVAAQHGYLWDIPCLKNSEIPLASNTNTKQQPLLLDSQVLGGIWRMAGVCVYWQV